MRHTLNHGATSALLVLIAVGAPLGAAFWMDRTDPEWSSNDWVALGAGLWSALWLLVVASVISADAQRRAEAVADAEVDRTIGALALAGARSTSGTDTTSLTIPSDAMAALKHYDATSGPQQRLLLSAIQVALTDIVFGTACRADSLPRSVWERLSSGTRRLHEQLVELASLEPDDTTRRQLDDTAALAQVCHMLGDALRRQHPPAEDGRITFSHIMQPGRSHGVLPAREDAGQALRVLERLYAQELAVVHDWKVLHDALGATASPEPAVGVSVSLETIESAREWYSPWYVAAAEGSGGRGPLRVVNVNRLPLDEATAGDTVEPADVLVTWPTPLRHGEIPTKIRERAVDHAHQLLQFQRVPATVCVLLYQLAPSYPDESPRRLVLDGNHRLAGAVRLMARTGLDRTSPEEAPRVLAFTIHETDPVESLTSQTRRHRDRVETWRWRGFTPDLENLRLPHDAPSSYLTQRQQVSAT